MQDQYLICFYHITKRLLNMLFLQLFFFKIKSNKYRFQDTVGFNHEVLNMDLVIYSKDTLINEFHPKQISLIMAFYTH